MILWTNIKFYGQLPFVNLSKRAKVIFLLRIVILLLTLILGSTLLGSKANHIPLYVLSTKQSDLAQGLFTALKQLSDQSNNFMTTSELKLITNYIEDHIEDTPEQIRTGLNDWCYVKYYHPPFTFDSDDPDYINDLEINDQIDMQNKTITCTGNKFGLFNYRQQLASIGFNIILSYAYSQDVDTTVDDATMRFTSDPNYSNYLDSTDNLANTGVNLLITTIAIQILLFISTFFYYGMRGNEMDDLNISLWTKNYMAVLTFSDLVLSIFSFAILVVQLSKIQSSVSSQLGSYGINMTFGKVFISISVTWLCFTIILFCLWAGPVWFSRSTNNKKIKNNQIPLPLNAYEFDYRYADESALNKDDDEEDEADDEDVDYSEDYDLESDMYKNRNQTRTFEIPIFEDTKSTITSITNPLEHRHSLSETDVSVKQPIVKNITFLRSDQLFNKRKAPTALNIDLSQSEEFIPLTPIMPPGEEDGKFSNTTQRSPSIRLDRGTP